MARILASGAAIGAEPVAAPAEPVPSLLPGGAAIRAATITLIPER